LSEVPDYVKASPRWRRLQEMNQELEGMSIKFVEYNEFLGRLQRQSARDQQEYLDFLNEEENLQK